jgi:hypothetical protein
VGNGYGARSVLETQKWGSDLIAVVNASNAVPIVPMVGTVEDEDGDG